MDKILVGSEEWCSLPELNIPLIKARVDSGAKTSSLHAFNIQPFHRNNALWVNFEVHPIQKDRKVSIHCQAKVVDRRSVKSSSGISENRFVIKSSFKIGAYNWDIEMTLTNRDSMGFRMLLGREAMIDRIMVDPGAIYLQREVTEPELEELYKDSRTEQSGLKIAVLASNPELYSNRRIIEAGEELGHTMEFLNIKHCYIKLDAENPEVHYRNGRVLAGVDAVIPRIRPSLTYYGCSLVRQFASQGVYCLNDADGISKSRDKLYSLQSLLANGIEIPITGFANSPSNTTDLINMVGGAPLVVKLLEGTQGKGVVLAETKKASESVINAFKSLKANILVQEFIREAGGKDLRCFVINGKVVASIQREAAPDDFRANLHQGGTASLVKISLDERKLAVKAAKLFNLKVAGVDIIRSRKGPLLLEVNSSPGLEGIENGTGKNIAGMMIESIEKQLNWSR